MPDEYPCLFLPNDMDDRGNRKGLRVDERVVLLMSSEDFRRLSEPEQAFVNWYRSEKENGLIYATFSGHPELEMRGDPLLDSVQADLCREIMAMHNAPKIEDPDIT